MEFKLIWRDKNGNKFKEVKLNNSQDKTKRIGTNDDLLPSSEEAWYWTTTDSTRVIINTDRLRLNSYDPLT